MHRDGLTVTRGERVFRLAYFVSHPIQYQAPLLRLIAQCEDIDLEVFFHSDHSLDEHVDVEFGQAIRWDVPLTEGYKHRFLASAGGGRPVAAGSVREQLERGRFDAVWLHGWGARLNRKVWRVARSLGMAVWMRGDTQLACVRGAWWQRRLHHWLMSAHFRRLDHCLAAGTANRLFYRAYGVPEEKITVMPYAVDNDFFQRRSAEAEAERDGMLERLGIERGRAVILFCGKLIEKKGLKTLIESMGCLNEEAGARAMGYKPPLLLVVGDGELRDGLEAIAQGVAPGCVKFLGFKNQSELPLYYALCDLFVIPSTYEPWGLVVNEVMNAARPIIASDVTGCVADLVQEDVNGSIFKAGDADGLAASLRPWLMDADMRRRGGVASLAMINRWGFKEDIVALREVMAKQRAEW